MKSLMNNKIVLFSLLVGILLMVLVYVTIISPKMQELASTRQQLASQRQMLEELQNRANITERMKDEDKIRIQNVRRQIPEKPYTEALLGDLRRLEVVSNIQFKQYQIQVDTKQNAAAAAPTEGSETTEGQEGQGNAASAASRLLVPVRITSAFSGKYSQINTMLQEMESLDRIVAIDKIQLNSKQNPGLTVNSQSPIEGTVTFLAYYAPSLQGLVKTGMNVDYKPVPNRNNPYE